MTSRTHDVIAFASLVTIASLYPPKDLGVVTLFASLVGNVVGALAPDMDQAGNRLWDMLPAGNTVGKLLRKVFYKHRTLSHSILGLLIFYKITEFILPMFFNSTFVNIHLLHVSLLIGYVSHLVADAFTKEGIPLLFPLNINFGFPPLEFLRITTGKWIEKYIVFPGVGLYLVWFVINHQANLIQLFQSLR